jgi:hypothetical protein
MVNGCLETRVTKCFCEQNHPTTTKNGTDCYSPHLLQYKCMIVSARKSSQNVKMSMVVMPKKRPKNLVTLFASNHFCATISNQGCQMVYFQTQNPNLGKYLRALDWKMLIYFIAIWNILRTLGYFMTIWYILCSFVTFFRFWVSCTKQIWQPCIYLTYENEENPNPA